MKLWTASRAVEGQAPLFWGRFAQTSHNFVFLYLYFSVYLFNDILDIKINNIKPIKIANTIAEMVFIAGNPIRIEFKL